MIGSVSWAARTNDTSPFEAILPSSTFRPCPSKSSAHGWAVGKALLNASSEITGMGEAERTDVSETGIIKEDNELGGSRVWPSPSSHPHPHGQAREFLGKIQSLIHDWTSRDLRSTKFIVFFDYPRFRLELKRATVEGRLKKRTTSVLSASPIPVISEDAFNKAFPTAQPWAEDFEGQGRKVELGKIASKGDVSFVLAAHETDPIIAAATKFGSIGGVELVSERTALVSGNGDYAMLISASVAKYRILPRKQANSRRFESVDILDLRR
ncbi:BZ3500_MvSof-1268-A1-R1_Chr2-1g04285 [Microbotryum saponariae]|uniref:BZ3500_MvSof-1268-A1-R1_Chr2-1g04285 protein n=1 Tax=Microbotryum saponariae TaxID=289078 RepID=A0A2X0K824_9BASI|nr:BZ3500_MvSof-1268-A1-R1_Chr2-1g04285 [Microbotryum saponariae]SCZ91322.1 BZ3501_MvSof-1269-A2-R1_Chr2-1g03941 [Microbotryum saponariae]